VETGIAFRGSFVSSAGIRKEPISFLGVTVATMMIHLAVGAPPTVDAAHGSRSP
jgi:hypothetical protein